MIKSGDRVLIKDKFSCISGCHRCVNYGDVQKVKEVREPIKKFEIPHSVNLYGSGTFICTEHVTIVPQDIYQGMLDNLASSVV